MNLPPSSVRIGVVFCLFLWWKMMSKMLFYPLKVVSRQYSKLMLPQRCSCRNHKIKGWSSLSSLILFYYQNQYSNDLVSYILFLLLFWWRADITEYASYICSSSLICSFAFIRISFVIWLLIGVIAAILLYAISCCLNSLSILINISYVILLFILKIKVSFYYLSRFCGKIFHFLL